MTGNTPERLEVVVYIVLLNKSGQCRFQYCMGFFNIWVLIEGAITTLNGGPLKLVNKFMYLSISSTEMWSIQWNKTGFLPGSGCVNTIL